MLHLRATLTYSRMFGKYQNGIFSDSLKVVKKFAKLNYSELKTRKSRNTRGIYKFNLNQLRWSRNRAGNPHEKMYLSIPR